MKKRQSKLLRVANVVVSIKKKNKKKILKNLFWMNIWSTLIKKHQKMVLNKTPQSKKIKNLQN